MIESEGGRRRMREGTRDDIERTAEEGRERESVKARGREEKRS